MNTMIWSLLGHGVMLFFCILFLNLGTKCSSSFPVKDFCQRPKCTSTDQVNTIFLKYFSKLPKYRHLWGPFTKFDIRIRTVHHK